MPSYDQDTILKKIVTYLRRNRRDKKMIDKFDDGHCSGLSLLYLYCKRLSTLPVRYENDRPVPRDDYDWFKTTLNYLLNWDGVSKMRRHKQIQISRFISLIGFFQEPDTIIPVGQGEMHKILEDTRGNKIKKEYSLAGLMTQTELASILPQIVHENRMLVFSTHNHAVALFKSGETFCFFDPNYEDGEIKTTSAELVAEEVFKANDFDSSHQCPLGIRAFHIPQENEQPVTYPTQQSILENLSFVKNKKVNRSYIQYERTKALHMAAKIDCTNSIKFLLDHGARMDTTDRIGFTPLMMAASRGFTSSAKLLINRGAKTNLKSKAKMTALNLAKEDRFMHCFNAMKKAKKERNKFLRQQALAKKQSPSLCSRLDTSMRQLGNRIYASLPSVHLFSIFRSKQNPAPTLSPTQINVIPTKK
jgi:hypothetical protein